VKVCVFGAGAIGGFLGVGLARAGVDVTLVARGEHLRAMQAHGLRLLIDGKEEVVRIACTDDPRKIGVQDYVIIALKAHTISEIAETIVPLLGPDTSVVTASNGIPYWYFYRAAGPITNVSLESIDPNGIQWRLLGPERAIGCVVFPATEIIAPGVIRHDHGRKFPLGEPDGTRSKRVERLSEILGASGFDAPVREDIRDEIWLKLWGNLCLNPISALTLATVDRVATDPGTRDICRAMMSEAQTLADRIGIHLRVDMERRLDGAAALGAHKMSMLQDLLRGRSMEIDPLVGVVKEIATLAGVATPVLDIVLALIRQRAENVHLNQIG